jgi:hypothetical protein
LLESFPSLMPSGAGHFFMDSISDAVSESACSIMNFSKSVMQQKYELLINVKPKISISILFGFYWETNYYFVLKRFIPYF